MSIIMSIHPIDISLKNKNVSVIRINSLGIVDVCTK